MKLLPFLMVMSAIALCTKANRAFRSIYGYNARPHQFPWLVDIYTKMSLLNGSAAEHLGEFVGSLIKEDFVLTGAYRQLSKKPGTSVVTEVRMGSIHRFAGVRRIAKRIHPYSCYDTYPCINRFGITLLHLNKPFKTGASISVIKLPEQSLDTNTWAEKLVRVVNWKGEAKTLVRYIDEEVIDYDSLDKYDFTKLQKDPWLLRIVDKGSIAACMGTRGGPLMYDQKGETMQIAVLIDAYDADSKICLKHVPQSAVRVDVYRDWIDEIMSTKKEVHVKCEIWSGVKLGAMYEVATSLPTKEEDTTSKASVQFDFDEYRDILCVKVFLDIIFFRQLCSLNEVF